jgi:hypothetical protein
MNTTQVTATAPEVVEIQLQGALSGASSLACWLTNSTHQFVQLPGTSAPGAPACNCQSFFAASKQTCLFASPSVKAGFAIFMHVMSLLQTEANGGASYYGHEFRRNKPSKCTFAGHTNALCEYVHRSSSHQRFLMKSRVLVKFAYFIYIVITKGWILKRKRVHKQLLCTPRLMAKCSSAHACRVTHVSRFLKSKHP